MSKWEMVRLGDCFKLTSGKFLPMKNRLEGTYNVFGGNGITGNHNEYFIDDPTIVIGRVGEYCGCVHITGEKVWVTDNALYATNFINELDNEFLCYILNKKDLNQFSNKSGQPSISQSTILNIEIPLPPLQIQKQIAKNLDTATELINLQKQQLAELDNLIKSVFYDMFGNPVSNEKGWEIKRLGEVAPTEQSKHKTMQSKVWLLNLDAIESNSGKILEYKHIPREKVGSSTIIFDETNVLYSKLRPYLNKVVMPYCLGYATSELLPLKPKYFILTREYLTFFLRNNEFVSFVSEKVSGAKMPRVVVKEFNNYMITLPPLVLQNKFATIVTKIEEQKSLVRKSLVESQYLFDSMMSEYFG